MNEAQLKEEYPIGSVCMAKIHLSPCSGKIKGHSDSKIIVELDRLMIPRNKPPYRIMEFEPKHVEVIKSE